MSTNRREFLALLTVPMWLRKAKAAVDFKLAICNEIYQDWEFADACKAAAAAGYDGLELAPFTFSDDPIHLSSDRRREIRKTMDSEGLVSTGLHWLLRAPGGLQITTPDATLRKKSWDYLRGLIDLAADLGDDPIMVLGSGKARGAIEGTTPDQAKARLAEGLASLAPTLESTGVKLLLEPLAPHLCNIVNTLGEAVEIVRKVNSPGVQTLFDVHNAAAEPLSHDLAIKKYRKYIKYAQINEMDGGYPGSANYDFKTMLKAFQEIGYDGWISMEVFNLTPGAEKIATESINHIRQQMSEL